MKIATEQREDHQIKIIIEAEQEEVESAKRRAARKIAKQVKIPGFRPGKAPYSVIERQVGTAAILEEAIEILANDLYPKALDEAGIEPYGPGMLENVSNVNPITLEFLTPLEAQVELGDYKAIRHPYELAPITDEDVENVLAEFRERQAIVEPVERPAQEGDQVRIVLSAIRLNQQEDENPVLVQERTLPVIIESENTDSSGEWPFPGFSRSLIGMQAHDEKTIVYSFPDDSQFESLRGLDAEFHITVEQVSQRTLPELGDEFANSISDESTLAELSERIRQDLRESRQHEYNHQYEDEVIDILVEQSNVKYPPQMVERELDDLINELGSRLAGQGVELETYLKLSNKDMDALRNELREVAEKRLKRSLVLFKVASEEEINVNPKEVQEETTTTLEYLSQALTEKELRKISSRERIQNLVGNIMIDMLVRKTIERLRLIASDQWKPEEAIDSDVTVPASEHASSRTAESHETEPLQIEELNDSVNMTANDIVHEVPDND